MIAYSIIVATKDNPTSLKMFLESLKACRILHKNNIEVIIVYNGSEQSNALEIEKVCRGYKGYKGYNVIYISEPCPGQSCAVNTGIAHANGKFIVFTDDDVEVYDKNWLDKLNRHFKEKKNLGYVSGNVKAKELKTEAQKIWEAKGGLSKGSQYKYFSKDFLKKFQI